MMTEMPSGSLGGDLRFMCRLNRRAVSYTHLDVYKRQSYAVHVSNNHRVVQCVFTIGKYFTVFTTLDSGVGLSLIHI